MSIELETMKLPIRKYTETKKDKQYSRHIIAISVDQVEKLLNAEQGIFSIQDNCLVLMIEKTKGDENGKKSQSVSNASSK